MEAVRILHKNQRGVRMSKVDLNRLFGAMMIGSMSVELAAAEAEDRRYLAKIEQEKEKAKYRQSKEFREARAKKKAQRKLRKKSQGR